MPAPIELTVGQCANLACLLEATAPKPGNVHRGSDFADLTFADLAVSGVVIAPVMQSIADGHLRVGEGVLRSVEATRAAVATNSNLGMILLFAPLAAAFGRGGVQQIGSVLGSLDAHDCRDVYQAIAQARAGGLGTVEQADVHGAPADDLIAAMRLAADRDLIARQYTNNFRDVLEFVVPNLQAGIAAGSNLADTVVRTHVRQMAEFPDSLIARKCGAEIAQQSAANAAAVLRSGEPGDDNYHEALADLDFWLRSDGHRRNPGTSADMIAAGLFVALHERIIQPPIRLFGMVK